ncbi:acyl--CoA ligase [Flavobacteriales bacterium]|nr:acyl--CoA ligase [Flavobacteriales bacterium]
MFQYVRNGVLQSVTGSQIDTLSTALACKLIREGVKKGDRIISVLKDRPLWNSVECAVLKSGAIHVPLPISVSEQKLTSVINMTKPVNILVDSVIQLKRIQSLGASLIKGTTISMVNERGLNSTNVNLEALKLRTESVKPQDTAVILFTSGSTGAPKGVLLSHHSILVAAEEFGHSDAFTGVQRSLSVLPMSHSAARKVNYACQLRGVTICYSAPTVSLFRNLQLFEAHHVALVPFLLQKLQEEIIRNPTKELQLHNVNCGGAPLSAEMWKWFDTIRIKVYEVYGLTETASLLSYSTDACRRPDCVGLKAQNVEIDIVNNDELAVKGPTMFQGYLLQDGSIQKPRGKDGWVLTGDCVKIDSDGGLRIIGRTVRSYKSQRGNHIHPEDLERELKSMEGVQEAFIIDEPKKRLQVVLVPSKAASLNSVKESLIMHNHSSNEDLKIWRFAILEHADYVDLQATEVMKIDSLTFNKLLKQLDLIEL